MCRLRRAHQEQELGRLRTEQICALAARRHHMDQDNVTTQLTGHLLIGHHEVAGAAHAYRGFDPSTGRELEPTFSAATPKDVDRAAVLARDAFDAYRATSAGQRADFLESIAAGVESPCEPLIARAMAATGLPRRRLEGERGRTAGPVAPVGAHAARRTVPAGHDRQRPTRAPIGAAARPAPAPDHARPRCGVRCQQQRRPKRRRFDWKGPDRWRKV